GGIAIDEEGVQREAGKSTITGVEMFKKHEERGDETKVADAGSAGCARENPPKPWPATSPRRGRTSTALPARTAAPATTMTSTRRPSTTQTRTSSHGSPI